MGGNPGPGMLKDRESSFVPSEATSCAEVSVLYARPRAFFPRCRVHATMLSAEMTPRSTQCRRQIHRKSGLENKSRKAGRGFTRKSETKGW